MVALGVLAPHIMQLTTRKCTKGSTKRSRSMDASDAKTMPSRMEAILSCMIKYDLQMRFYHGHVYAPDVKAVCQA
eukprot:scaffold137023_cov21-Tisochrysis_lutea.AAC.1